jgi:hypothetical protein
MQAHASILSAILTYVMRSTLKRGLQHPDLQNPDNPEISWKFNGLLVGLEERATTLTTF